MSKAMATTQDFANWVCGPRLRAEYLLYALRAMSDEFRRMTMGSTHQTIYMPDIRRLAIPIPPLEEQDRIVAFLRARLPRVDALIDKKQRLVGLLEEKRQAVIGLAVTKGVDPSAATKDSGVDWLGRVPASWTIARIRQMARLKSGHTPSRQHPEYWVPSECTIPWVSLADVWQLRDGKMDYLEATGEMISPLGLANSPAQLLPAGTVILSRTASVGFSAILRVPMATTQDFVNWICGPRLLPEFLLWVFRAMTQEFDRLTMGSVHRTIYMPDVAKLTMAVPPLEEQERIVRYLRTELEKAAAVVELVGRQLQILREYRQELITAAITGRREVAKEAA